MKQEEREGATAGGWTVELACGHRIDVPDVAGALATIACVREHRRSHHRLDREETGPFHDAFPISALVAEADL